MKKKVHNFKTLTIRAVNLLEQEIAQINKSNKMKKRQQRKINPSTDRRARGRSRTEFMTGEIRNTAEYRIGTPSMT